VWRSTEQHLAMPGLSRTSRGRTCVCAEPYCTYGYHLFRITHSQPPSRALPPRLSNPQLACTGSALAAETGECKPSDRSCKPAEFKGEWYGEVRGA